MENNIVKSLFTTNMSLDSEGFPDNLARVLVNYVQTSSYDCDIPLYDSENDCYWKNGEMLYYDRKTDCFYGSDYISEDEDDDSIFSDYDFDYIYFDNINNLNFNKVLLDTKEELGYQLTLIFDGKFYEIPLFMNSYTLRVGNLVNFLHNELNVNNFNLIRKCDYLNVTDILYHEDIVHVNGNFDKYLMESWNKIMHSINGNINTRNKKSMKTVMVREDADHLPTKTDKIATRTRDKNVFVGKQYTGMSISSMISKLGNVRPWNQISPKVSAELSSREENLDVNRGIRLDVPIPAPSTEINVSNNIKPDEPKKKKIFKPRFNSDGSLLNKKYTYDYVTEDIKPLFKAQAATKWFGFIPKYSIIKSTEDSYCRYNCLILFIFNILFLLYTLSKFDIEGLGVKLITTRSPNFHGSLYYYYWSCLGPCILLLINMINNINNNYISYVVKLVVILLCCYRNYERFYRYFSWVNFSVVKIHLGQSRYSRTCTIRNSCDSDHKFADFQEDEDYRRETDVNFKIKQETQLYYFDEKLQHITDIGYIDYNGKFNIIKSFDKIDESGYNVVDLELVSQISTSKNISMNSSPQAIAERMMNSTNMGPFINYDRGEVFYNDMLNNSARLAHCIAMSMRYSRLSSDVYSHFRQGDAMRLTGTAQMYSLYY